MIIEGKNAVKEALNSKMTITKLYIQNNIHDTEAVLQLAKANKIKIQFVDKSTMDKTSPSGRHQGLIAFADEFSYCEIDDIIAHAKQKGEKLFIVILDGIEDPHNLGSIIRVCECAGVHGIIIPKHRAVSVNDTVLKTSAGSAVHMKVAMVTNINDTIRKLRDEFVNVCCADMDGKSIYSSHMKQDLALVIGGEGSGVKQLTKKLCSECFAIPQFGQVNSLNASVATAIFVYEVVRQRLSN